MQGHSSFCSLFVCEQVCRELVHGCKRETHEIRTARMQQKNMGREQRKEGGGVKNREEVTQVSATARV